jgi:16S rRNA (guanine(527)-N(7))-methyltransferase RsmG
MRNGNAAADSPLQLPPDLEPDFLEFKARLAQRIDSGTMSGETFQLLTRFGCLVHKQAAQLALIAHGDRAVLFTRHVLDSLNPIDLFVQPPTSLLDVGSGGGFPGIPLAIAWPETRVTLLESREKKCGFLERAVRELGLKNVKMACARLEDFGKSWTADAHACVFIRAVGGLPALLSIAERAVTRDAQWVYFLGGEISVEALREDLGPRGVGAVVRSGAFGGRLLIGRFYPESADRENSGRE